MGENSNENWREEIPETFIHINLIYQSSYWHFETE